MLFCEFVGVAERKLFMRDIGELFEGMVKDLTEDEIAALCDRLVKFIQEREHASSDAVAA